MLSMTGYGFAERLTELYQMSVEVKSYNNRFLEINHNMPNTLSRFEQEIDARIKEVASRGHIELGVRLRMLGSDISLHVDQIAIQRYREAFEKIKAIACIEEDERLHDYLEAEGVLIPIRENDPAIFAEPLFELLAQALGQFRHAKEHEGEATKVDLARLIDRLESGLSGVEMFAQTLEERLKENLLSKFDEMLGSKGYDDNRFLQEVAILLSKYSVNEEIVRLKTHIGSFRNLLFERDPVGKRLDFLAQEMNREINTIGSKSILVEINQHVVGMKDSLENIREQVRNIE